MTLTNEDFRRMWKSEMKVDEEEKTVGELTKEELKKYLYPKEDKQKNKKAKKTQGSGKSAKPKAEKERSAPKYRDLAEERREQQELIDQSEQEIRGFDVEQSKYLGGDEEHTHMVKGLDYQLLEKQRQEILDARLKEEEELKRRQASRAATQTVIVSPMAQNIVNYLSKATKSRDISKSRLFLRHRQMIQFDLHDTSPQYAIPNLSINELSFNDKDNEEVFCAVSDSVAETVRLALECGKDDSKKKRMKRSFDTTGSILKQQKITQLQTAQVAPPPVKKIFADVEDDYELDSDSV